MRVCVIGTRGFPYQGGVEKHCECLYPELAQQCQITILARKPYVPKKQCCRGVKIVPLWSPKTKGIEAFFHSIWAGIQSLYRHPDLIHIHNIGPAIVAPFLKLFGLKIVLTYHSPNYLHAKWGIFARSILRLAERLAVRISDAIIVVSETNKKLLRQKYGGIDVHVITNGIEIQDRNNSSSYLAKIGVQKNKYVLAVGRLTQEKGFCDLIEAFRNIDTDWKLVIVGGSDNKTAYSKELKKQALDCKNIVMTGFIVGEPLEELYSHAGLFVLPSYHEGFPIVLLEALSYGLSVLASDIPPNKEVGLDKEQYFKVGHTEKLKEQIVFWMNHPLTENKRVSQIERVRDKYSWERIAVETLEVYRNAIANTRGR